MTSVDILHILNAFLMILLPEIVEEKKKNNLFDLMQFIPFFFKQYFGSIMDLSLQKIFINN